ncbi:tripartite-type tricarboxylate transporter receptor subunit TctC [Cupriavidus gilardii J11]|uniref:Tripartite-type tricarboxylate transporter receptor subunit TctC n=1 Tax=Cupriavidus gilardii J11 TaxID=936133 RepID=A0A562B1B8_9BURK|nr:tripartite tricarboxylate transporter substrate binding protein [Cupriavidus gilardii]TWG79032.1 tripartite-type tricarboxylate transporter receptor subunit TctC [Cupriavidus gilardii J11]
MKLFRIAAAVAMAGTTLFSAATQAADAFPSRPITLIVPWNAGGSVDLTARKLSEILGKSGVTVVVENVPGASSTIGLTKVANAAPDGYTVGLATSSLMGVVAQNMTKLRVDQFTALNQTTVEQLILVVPKSSPVNTIEDFVALMRKKPGGVSIGTPGNNNVNHTFGAMLARANKVEFVNVPYTGGAKVLTDLAGNQIDAGVLKPSETLSQINGGLIKPVGVFSHERVAIMPNVPTFAEKKIDVFPFGALEQMSYLVGPRNLPAERARQLQELFAKAIASDAYQAFTREFGMKVSDVRGDELQKQVVAIQNTFNTVAPKIFTKQP